MAEIVIVCGVAEQAYVLHAVTFIVALSGHTSEAVLMIVIVSAVSFNSPLLTVGIV